MARRALAVSTLICRIRQRRVWLWMTSPLLPLFNRIRLRIDRLGLEWIAQTHFIARKDAVGSDLCWLRLFARLRTCCVLRNE